MGWDLVPFPLNLGGSDCDLFRPEPSVSGAPTRVFTFALLGSSA